MSWRHLLSTLLGLSALAVASCSGTHFEQRNQAAPLRPLFTRYSSAFFYRHNDAFRFSAGVHFAHAKQHDVLQLTELSDAFYHDPAFDAECLDFVYDPPRTEPHMFYWGPYVGQFAWKLYRAIDWTHVHHEQTYDILSYSGIPWDKKKEWTNNAVRYYLAKDPLARSPAPLDVTMRRAGVMMKPYFSIFRNNYPRSNDFFYVAHWWHPVIYEAMMIAGNDDEQDTAVSQTHRITFTEVIHDRPLRMLLSREVMPRYSRMSPESANIFDNLHMLHGIAYDVLAYEGWTTEEKRAELYRVIDAMGYQPGDEALAREFETPYPDMDPRVYYDWMKPVEGEMNRIMREMLQEMMPVMMPQGMDDEMHETAMEQLRLKLTPGMQEGEVRGSLHDALRDLMPSMQMDPESMQPGRTPIRMVEAMLAGWREKYGDMEDVAPFPMVDDPRLPPVPREAAPELPARKSIARN